MRLSIIAFGVPECIQTTLHGSRRPPGDAPDPKGDGVYDIEYRVIGKTDGVERWIATRGRTQFENDSWGRTRYHRSESCQRRA
jgi:hypothetical protein